jgi:hypothetical protein
MNFALISKIAAAVLGVGLVATTVGFILPSPDGTTSIWIDQPVANSVVATGPVVIAAHASYTDVTSFRFVIRRDGSTVKVLNDTSLTVEKKDKSGGYGRLVSGAVEWPSSPGVYTIEPRYLAGGSWTTGTPVTVTVLDTPPPDAETPTNSPTQPPTDDEPIIEPTAEPTVAPTTPPATFPQPTSAPTPPQMPTGTVQRSAPDTSGHRSTFYVSNITPEFVDVDVQVRTKSEYDSQWTTWASLGCSDLTKEVWSTPQKSYFQCSVQNHIFKASSQERQAEVRVVITNYDDESLVWTSNGPSWTITRSIG